MYTLDIYLIISKDALPETNSLPLKIRHPQRKGLSSNHPFSGAFAVSFKEGRQIRKDYPTRKKNICQITLPETNIGPENNPLEKEIPLGNHHF